MDKKLYILLKYFNQYDQEGGYFAGVFDSYEKARNSVHHIGRKDSEFGWYQIKEVDINYHYINLIDDYDEDFFNK